jgi:rubrerythrin
LQAIAFHQFTTATPRRLGSADVGRRPEENAMAVRLLDGRGTPLDKQKFTWKEIVGPPISKLDDDAFTRVRIILMNGIEQQANRFQHALAQMNGELREAAARIRRVEHHQQTMVNWLLSPDHSPLETTIGYEQVAIEVTAAVAQQEPDPYLAQVYRFGLLEDFDHMYRYSALMDRVEGKDANNILQCYTDICPGRPTSEEHRAPADDLRTPYERLTADPISKLHALTIMSGEYQTRDYYMTIGPTFTDPVARQLYAEIASIEEQHVTQYGSLLDPNETWLERWMLYEANEAYNYYSCMESESNPRIKAIWERFLDYELGHLEMVKRLFEKHERRDPAEILPDYLPDPIAYESQREFVRQTLREEVDLRANGENFVPRDQEPRATREYREHLNSEGSPSDAVAAGYQWQPGTELGGETPKAA